MSETLVSTEGNANVLCYSRSNVDIHGLCCCWESYLSEWPKLPSKAMVVVSGSILLLKARFGSMVLLKPESVLMFVANVITKGRVEIRGL